MLPGRRSRIRSTRLAALYSVRTSLPSGWVTETGRLRASKAAVVNLSKFFATHWAGRGVRVNTLSPGGVLAGQDDRFKEKYSARVPLGRMAVEEDLKGPLVFLASSASSYVTGHELRVDGGFTAW